MKKLILIVAALLLVFGANAQKKTYCYVKGGVSFNTMAGDAVKTLAVDNDYVKYNVGYDAMFGFQTRIIPGAGLYLGSEIGMGTRGVQVSGTEVVSKEKVGIIIRQTHHAIKATPLQIGYRFDIGDGHFSIDGHIGAFVSYDLFGGTKYTSAGETTTAKLSDYKEGINLYDVGINPGIALWFGHFGIDFTYQRGFICPNKETKTDSGYQNLIIRAAIRF